jgi:hypothetical protein
MTPREKYEIIAYLLPLIVAILFSCNTAQPTQSDPYIKEVLSIEKDEEGLLYIRYVKATGDTAALDAITVQGLNELMKGNIQSVYRDEPAHVCYDAAHYECDGLCVCDGMECTTAINQVKQ